LADDTALFSGSKQEVSNAMNEIEIFSSFSELVLNRNKTEGIWIGKFKYCKDKIEKLTWNEKPIKFLAVYFGHVKNYCEKFGNKNKKMIIY